MDELGEVLFVGFLLLSLLISVFFGPIVVWYRSRCSKGREKEDGDKKMKLDKKRLKSSIFVFLGFLGLSLIIVKVVGLFGMSIWWLYIPMGMLGLVAATQDYKKS